MYQIRPSGKEKLHWIELNRSNRQERLYSQQLQQGKEKELKFTKTKNGRTFQHWNELVEKR